MIIKSETFLRKKSKPVSSVIEANQIIDKLIQELSKIPHGAGLSAPQIGILKQVAIVKSTNMRQTNYIKIVNPTIASEEGEQIINNEGCLSFPKKHIRTKRPQEIEFYSQWDEFDSGVALDFEAAAVQHEIDHLHGILMFDRQFKLKPIVSSRKYGRNDKCPDCGRKIKKCEHRDIYLD